jgi:hypothetical protein
MFTYSIKEFRLCQTVFRFNCWCRHFIFYAQTSIFSFIPFLFYYNIKYSHHKMVILSRLFHLIHSTRHPIVTTKPIPSKDSGGKRGKQTRKYNQIYLQQEQETSEPPPPVADI